MQTLSQTVRFAKEALPPMTDEPDQAEIDAKQAEILREGIKKFVFVVPDGHLWRWRRQAGPGTSFISREAFVNLADAIAAAVVIAQCYGPGVRA